MKVFLDYRDENLRKLLLEMLYTFRVLNENQIDDNVAISHYLGKVDAGEIVLAQGSPYSEKWRANILDLKEEGLVAVEEKGYRVFSLASRKRPSTKFLDLLEKLKKMRGIERNELALRLHRQAVENYNKFGELE